jgi:glycosyltransferase involved in cell wall biosynthesis
MRKLRIGIFGRDTVPADGGSDTLLQMIARQLAAGPAREAVELVPVEWAQWSYRRQPLRYLWMRLARPWGLEIPPTDVRPACRRLDLDAAYFAAPAFAVVDVPFAFTLWDLGHRTIPEFPEMRSARDPWSQREAMYRQMLGQASVIITGNETGAAEAIRYYAVPRERLVVQPFPNPDFGGVPAERPAWQPTRPFFLYPAQLWPHKNHATLLRALALVPEVELVFVGSDKGNGAALRALAVELGVAERVRFGGFVSRGELRGLYENAAGLAFASLLGPNNLPPQEAAVLGCPMILSDLPGHREQLGAGALYAAPLEAPAWAEAMRALLAEPVRKAELIAAARTAVAGCTLEAYGAALGRVCARLAAVRRLRP